MSPSIPISTLSCWPRMIMDHPIPPANPTMARYRAKQRRIDRCPARKLGRQGRRIGPLTAARRTLHDRACCRISRLAIGAPSIGIFSTAARAFPPFLNEQRAELVTRLIEDSNRPLAGIAELLGFSAQSAMARWFRGHFGCSITQWRSGVRPAALTVGTARGAIGRGRPARKPGQASPAQQRSKRLKR